MSLVTPLNRVLGLGSAKGGAEHWWLQRVTAVALAALGLWLAVSLATLPDFTYPTVVIWIEHPATTILLFLTVLTATYHSYLGVQVVLEDYVHHGGLKALSLMLSTFVHFAVALAGVYAIAKASFGAVT